MDTSTGADSGADPNDDTKAGPDSDTPAHPQARDHASAKACSDGDSSPCADTATGSRGSCAAGCPIARCGGTCAHTRSSSAAGFGRRFSEPSNATRAVAVGLDCRGYDRGCSGWIWSKALALAQVDAGLPD